MILAMQYWDWIDYTFGIVFIMGFMIFCFRWGYITKKYQEEYYAKKNKQKELINNE